MEGGRVPGIVVLVLGAGALGGVDALRLLLAFAGRNPAVDIAICLLVMAMVAAQLLGAVTLVRFVRKARPGAPGVPAVNIFDRVTLVLSMGVGFLVTACLVVVPLVTSGGVGSVRLLVAVLGGVGAAASAAAFLCKRPLLRVFLDAGNAGATDPVARATGRLVTAFRRKVCNLTGPSLAAAGLVLVISFAAHGGRDAPRLLFPGFTNKNTLAGVAIVGIPLLVRFSRSAAGNAAGGAAPGRATNAGSFGKLTRVASLVIVAFSALICLLVNEYAPPTQRAPECANYPCSV